MPKVTIFFLAFFTIFLSSCSNYKTALDLEVGDCYIDLSLNNTEAGDTTDLDYVEVVSCSQPHNFEIIAEYLSVPAAYRSIENPVDETCLDATFKFIESIYPNSDESLDLKILDKFDERFMYFSNFNRISIFSSEPDLNDYFNCAIHSKDSLNIGIFKKTIESFN